MRRQPMTQYVHEGYWQYIFQLSLVSKNVNHERETISVL